MSSSAFPLRRPFRGAGFLTILALAVIAVLCALPASSQSLLAGTTEEAPAEAETSVAEALRLLAIVLDDPSARSALVEQLRAVEPDAATLPSAEPAEDGEEAAASLPRIIADQTLGAAEDAARGLADVADDLLSVADFPELAQSYDFGRAWEDVGPVLVLVVAVILSLWLFRLACLPLLGRFSAAVQVARSDIGRFVARLGGVLVDIARVLLAWATGHGLALLFGDGAITLPQTLFLNAFLAVEMAKRVPRFVLRPSHPGLRLLAISGATARHWNFWAERILGILGYGTLFAVPLVALEGAPRASQWILLVSVLVAMGITIILALRNREQVRDGLQKRLRASRTDMIVAWLYPLAHQWHLIAIGYVIALFVVWRAVPWNAVGFMLRATAGSLVLILIGSFLIALITRRIDGGIVVNERTRESFPLLETRLNHFVPTALQVLRVVSAIVVIAGILTFWGIIDAPRWLSTPAGRTVVWGFAWIAGVILVAAIIYIIVSSWIEYRLNPDVGKAPTPRERTLLALFSNAFVIVLAIITVMTVLTQLGINIAPLLAGAGVVGLAIGFGAQKLVQDIINGAFIQLENTMNEGDVVTAGPITGAVEKLTIRSVSLRDFHGLLHMIPFSSVDIVSNFTKDYSFHVADIGVAYRENVADVQQAMQDAFDRLMETDQRAHILPPFEMFGIDQFGDSAVVVRARIKTLPGKQWDVGRAYNAMVKDVFDERGIEMPFPHRTIYLGVDREGAAPPLNIRSLGRAPGSASDGTEAGEKPPAPPPGLAAPL